MEKRKENLELDGYLKNTKEANKYKGKKEVNNKVNENKNQDTIVNELDEYMKKISENNRLKAKKSNNTREPSGIVYDFIKVTNHTIEDITLSLNNSVNKTIEDMTYSLHKSMDKTVKDITYSLNSIKKTQEIKGQVNNIKKEKEPVKQDIKEIDIKKELDKAKNIDKELYKNLEAISKMTNREMDHLNNTYKEYNNLINLAGECNLRLGYEQRMSGVKIYGESKRSIEAQQRELVNIVKGETKEHQVLESSKKSMNYLDSAEKKIKDLKSQNKLLDLKGNIERNQIIKDIRKEMERHEQILKDAGINSKEDLNKLKDEVKSKEDYAKKVLSSEKQTYKQERAEMKRTIQPEKQVEKNSQDKQQQYYKKTKGLGLER